MAKVLVIDDSRLSVSALQNMIGDLGHSVVGIAHSGEDGIEKAKSLSPNIVCLDYVMPGIDGKETAMKLIQQNPNIKIIMITQNPVDDSSRRDIKAIHYIVKPITKNKLEEAFGKI